MRGSRAWWKEGKHVGRGVTRDVGRSHSLRQRMLNLSVAMVGTSDMMVSVTRTPLSEVTDCWSTPLSVASSVTSKSGGEARAHSASARRHIKYVCARE